MTVKTDISRFDIHDELTAPEGSVKILKGVQTRRRVDLEVHRRARRRAGGAARLRAHAPRAARRLAAPGDPRADRARGRRAARRPLLDRPAREDGARGRARPRRDLARAQLRLRRPQARRRCSPSSRRWSATDGRPAQHLAEEAREHDWTDEELLEAVAHLAMNEFQSLIANAAALPQDQSDPAVLPNAA